MKTQRRTETSRKGRPGIVLVTGAGGLIGRAVVMRLLRNDRPIRAWYGPEDTPRAGGAFGIVQGSILDADLARQALEDVTTVIHLAGPPSDRESLAAASKTVNVHTLGTAVLLEAIADRARKSTFVYASSAAVYGRPSVCPVPESAPIDPGSPYAAAKVAAEALVRSSCRHAGLRAAILRPFSVYGPAMNPAGVVAEILSQIIDPNRDQVTIRDAHPVRDFTHVDDVARAFVTAAGTHLAAGEHDTWNAGSGVATSIGELARCLVAMSRRQMPVVPDDGSPDNVASDTSMLVADIDKIGAELGWAPAITLEDGLHKLLRDRQKDVQRIGTQTCA